MVKCLFAIKNFVKSVFIQDESIGLKSIEKVKIIPEFYVSKKESDFKFSDIMK